MRAFFSLASVFLLAASTATQASPVVTIHSGSELLVSSANIHPAPGGGVYVSGLSRPALGISAPMRPHLHITAYDKKGNVLLDRVDVLNRSRLAVSHYSPRPAAPYAAYLPVDASRLGSVVITPHSGHRHTETANLPQR